MIAELLPDLEGNKKVMMDRMHLILRTVTQPHQTVPKQIRTNRLIVKLCYFL